jgi:RimJ/RimL family protein N-acetyltransferase
MSFLLNPELVNVENIYEEYFTKFIDFMKEVNFSILDFHKLFTETYSHRSFNISILENAGFKLEGILRDHIIIKKKYFNSLIHSIIKNV